MNKVSLTIPNTINYANAINNIDLNTINNSNTIINVFRGGSRTSGKGVHMYKCVGFTLLILSHFFKYTMKM